MHVAPGKKVEQYMKLPPKNNEKENLTIYQLL